MGNVQIDPGFHATSDDTCEPERIVCACGNCGHECSIDDLQPIQRYFERVIEGEDEPAGECPVCGCLSHEVADEVTA